MSRPDPISRDPAPRGGAGVDPADINLLALSPIRIGSVVLAVRDLDAMGKFYRHAIGLAMLGRDEREQQLGAGGHVLLTLLYDPEAALAPRNGAGLYHTAFLLPERADLGAWLAHVGEEVVAIDGSADHLVSEAVYLTDPEGNGIEVYADRPSSTWYSPGRCPEMATAPLDSPGLLRAAAERRWFGMPDAGCIGHVHLRVGDIAATDAFYAGLLGFDCNPFASLAHFYSTGGYHHQIGANCWQSCGAPPRREGTTGLVEVQLVHRDPTVLETSRSRLAALGQLLQHDGCNLVAIDPGGVAVRLTSPAG